MSHGGHHGGESVVSDACVARASGSRSEGRDDGYKGMVGSSRKGDARRGRRCRKEGERQGTGKGGERGEDGREEREGGARRGDAKDERAGFWARTTRHWQARPFGGSKGTK